MISSAFGKRRSSEHAHFTLAHEVKDAPSQGLHEMGTAVGVDPGTCMGFPAW